MVGGVLLFSIDSKGGGQLLEGIGVQLMGDASEGCYYVRKCGNYFIFNFIFSPNVKNRFLSDNILVLLQAGSIGRRRRIETFGR